MIDNKEIFSKLPHIFQLPLAKAYCYRKKKWAQDLKTPVALIFFVTARCNLRCKHCFYWQKLNNRENELNIDEIKKIALSLKHPVSLSLTGGEPFLRNDLSEIIEVFCQGCGTKEVGIATNGFLSETIVKNIDLILKKNIYLQLLSIQVSLDGLERTHDEIRGIKNSFSNALSTIKELNKIKKRHSGFQLHVALAVQKCNLNELKDFVEYFLPLEIPLRFNIVRGEGFGVFGLPNCTSSDFDPKDGSSIFLSLEEIKETYSLLKKICNNNSYRTWSKRQQRIWELSIRMLEEQKSEIPCFAGSMESVLYPNGDVSFCELTKPFANINEFGYDYQRLWRSEKAEKMRRSIAKCFCIHGCNLTTSLTFEPETVINVLKERS